ncbi:MAG: transketolase [Lentisphaerae bacterium RIFOXYA12_FULL_48_11]|nr:MAG: transketolase [Lentisphaerae bacterium RIFOXYA12_FULL_48_11]
MSNVAMKAMRDALIEGVYRRMQDDRRIFFLSADMGAPVLDKLRADFRDRFINIGIAEQNLINVATGLALEGFVVYAYAIAPFVLRAYEQIRINLALSSQIRQLNVNIVGTGAGVSYDVSGPTHHCLEDLSVMRTLPNIVVCSPSDSCLAQLFVDYSIHTKKPKYIRLDGKPLPFIYNESMAPSFEKGFYELVKGDKACIVSSGYMTHMALEISKEIEDKSIGVVDIFTIKPIDEMSLFEILKSYKTVITLEEGFIGKGGLDSLVLCLLNDLQADVRVKRFGFKDEYLFKVGSRDFLHNQSGFDKKSVRDWILNECL